MNSFFECIQIRVCETENKSFCENPISDYLWTPRDLNCVFKKFDKTQGVKANTFHPFKVKIFFML